MRGHAKATALHVRKQERRHNTKTVNFLISRVYSDSDRVGGEGWQVGQLLPMRMVASASAWTTDALIIPEPGMR